MWKEKFKQNCVVGVSVIIILVNVQWTWTLKL